MPNFTVNKKLSVFQVPFHIVPIRVDGIVSFLFKPTSISEASTTESMLNYLDDFATCIQ